MAEPMFSFELETDAIVAALDTLGDAATPFIRDASFLSAKSIESEAVSRLRRQLGPNATGETEAGIEVLPDFAGTGWVVVSGNERMPNLPLWIEEGTSKGKPRSHSEPARPYFHVAVELEQGAHYRRIGAALQDAIDEQGLGD